MIGSSRIFGVVAKQRKLLFPTHIVSSEPEICVSVKPSQFANNYCFIIPTQRLSLSFAVLLDDFCRLEAYYAIRRKSEELLNNLCKDKKLTKRRETRVRNSFKQEINDVIEVVEKRFASLDSFEELIYRYQTFSRVELWFVRDEKTKEYQLTEKIKHYIPINDWFVLNINYDEVFYPLVQSIVDNTTSLEQAIPMFNKQGLFKDHCIVSTEMMTSEVNKKNRNHDLGLVMITNDLFEHLLKEIK